MCYGLPKQTLEAVLHGQYILGSQVAAFEKKFGNYLRDASVVAVASATDTG
jgi:dTDP-4-amino-4,6-dideoxygalactose transaminase